MAGNVTFSKLIADHGTNAIIIEAGQVFRGEYGGAFDDFIRPGDPVSRLKVRFMDGFVHEFVDYGSDLEIAHRIAEDELERGIPRSPGGRVELLRQGEYCDLVLWGEDE